jgi:hypothetical protein
MKKAVEMGSGAMILVYVPSFMKIGSGFLKLIVGDSQRAHRSHKPLYVFSK